MPSGDTSPMPVTMTRLLNVPPSPLAGARAYFFLECDSMY